jgi:hypothetical protein
MLKYNIIPIEINKGVRKKCSLSPILFNIYTDKVINDWLQVIKQNILAKDLILNTILFTDDQVIEASTEDCKEFTLINDSKICQLI